MPIIKIKSESTASAITNKRHLVWLLLVFLHTIPNFVRSILHTALLFYIPKANIRSSSSFREPVFSEKTNKKVTRRKEVLKGFLLKSL